MLFVSNIILLITFLLNNMQPLFELLFKNRQSFFL